MKNWLVYFSISLNVVLLLIAVFFIVATFSTGKDRDYINNARIQDTKIFEQLLLGRLSKQQATQTLTTYFGKNVSSIDWLAVPEEHGIRAGSFVMVFDAKDKLSKIEIDDLEGP